MSRKRYQLNDGTEHLSMLQWPASCMLHNSCCRIAGDECLVYLMRHQGQMLPEALPYCWCICVWLDVHHPWLSLAFPHTLGSVCPGHGLLPSSAGGVCTVGFCPILSVNNFPPKISILQCYPVWYLAILTVVVS